MFGKISMIGIAALALATSASAEKYEWGNVRFDGGGFVSAVMFHPKAENLLYARTDVGGIYRFDFENKTWIPLMDFISLHLGKRQGPLRYRSLCSRPQRSQAHLRARRYRLFQQGPHGRAPQ